MIDGTIFNKLPIWKPLLFPAKAIGRKSRLQPQTWFLLDRNKVLYIVKFSAGSENANSLVEREGDFYGRLEQYRNESNVVDALPRLISSGRFFGGCFIVLEYCNLKSPGRWIPRMMRWASSMVLRWQAGILDWLLRFQQDPIVHEALAVPHGHVPCHCDFSHFNILGNGGNLKVFDWENWRATEYAFLDAFHLIFQPTVGLSNNDALVNLKRFWVADNPYRKSALENLIPFLSGMDWREAMGIYLGFQSNLLLLQAPEIARTFDLCEASWKQYESL